MSHKRFLNILLVVLSLALWAGTATLLLQQVSLHKRICSAYNGMSLTYITGGGNFQSLATDTITISYSAAAIAAIATPDLGNAYIISAPDGPVGCKRWQVQTSPPPPRLRLSSLLTWLACR